jgi:hypothetical protein
MVKQIRPGAGDEQAVRLRGRAAVTHLGEPGYALDDADGVLDFGGDARARSIARALPLVQVLETVSPFLSSGYRGWL